MSPTSDCELGMHREVYTRRQDRSVESAFEHPNTSLRTAPLFGRLREWCRKHRRPWTAFVCVMSLPAAFLALGFVCAVVPSLRQPGCYHDYERASTSPADTLFTGNPMPDVSDVACTCDACSCSATLAFKTQQVCYLLLIMRYLVQAF